MELAFLVWGFLGPDAAFLKAFQFGFVWERLPSSMTWTPIAAPDHA